MIDKSQSARGMRYNDTYNRQLIHLIKCLRISDVEKGANFGGWTTQGFKEETSRRTDYETDKEGRLIRVGNQIDKELYPAEGLKYEFCYYRSDGTVATAFANPGNSIAAVESFPSFVKWADTPRNRELGLLDKLVDNKEKRLAKLEAAGKKMDQRLSSKQIAEMVHTQNKSLERKSQLHYIAPKVQCPDFSVDYAAVERRMYESLGVPATYYGVPDRKVRQEWEKLLDGVDEAKPGDYLKETLRGRFSCDALSKENLPLYKYTTYIKAHLPDGRIIESPLASTEDGWEECDLYQWQIGEAGIGSVVNTDATGVLSARILDVFEFDGIEKDMLELSFNRKEDQCWAKDMLPVLLTQDKKGDVIKYTSVLEARIFRKPIARHRSFAHTFETLYGDFESLMKPLEADYGEYDDADWPEGGHPRRVIHEPRT